jgi:acetyl esterase/lipase
MNSLQCLGLRLILKVRRAFIDWEAPVERFRAMVRRSEPHFKLPRDVDVKPAVTDGVPGEWLIPRDASPRPVLLYLHGGGWTLGWNQIHRRMVAHLCRAAAIRALAVDYRLAPEHPFPAALEDCRAAYRRLLKDGTAPGDIVIAGDSAGGNLTLAMLLALRDAGDPLPAAAVCISPMTDLEGTGESFRTKKDPALTAEFALLMARHYAGEQDPRLPLLSPYHGDLRGLPPLLIHVGGDEILLSDATRFADKARAAGVDVSLAVWPKLWHVWHFFAPSLPEARRAIDAIAAFIRGRLMPAEP